MTRCLRRTAGTFLTLFAVACQDIHAPFQEPPDLTGEWDFDLALPGDEGGTCHVLGAAQLAQVDSTLTGSLTGYVSMCGFGATGVIQAGAHSVAQITFRSGNCTYTADILGSPPDSLNGTLSCGYLAGTWSAARVGTPDHLVLDPQDRSLALGGAQAYRATLYDAAEHVLYGRIVAWSTDAPSVATVSASGLVTAVGPGSARITAAAGGLSAAVTVQAAAASFVSVAPGQYHTCALTAAGVAWCWGANSSGELGDGAGIRSNAPIPVTGAHTWRSLSSGWGFTCGVTTAGAAWCWGANFAGQLGTGDTVASAAPRPVLTARTFSLVVAGGHHACGLTANGEAWCWGMNARGQVGNGTRTNTNAPTQVVGYSFNALGAGQDHTCGIAVGGVAFCWGQNASGQLGSGATDSNGVTSPVAVAGGISFVSAGGGRLHSCGLAAGGAVYCWGGGVYGQIGNGSRATALTPALVSGNHTYAALSAGSEHNSALAAGGQAYGWGSNGVGESGDSAQTEWDTPAMVPGSFVFASVAAGGFHTCGITTGGVTYCWGYNADGQIGDGTRTDRRFPARVIGQP
jgi:alpha-tubulin suppressor-like RCC1 family protein